ncbi:MAG: hypothetical protein KAR20_19345 [Candidatus Heimdallarchaeota archaeon]|nr:hypothetical protein [Candidatus Heimdallarchaeota archaeon]
MNEYVLNCRMERIEKSQSIIKEQLTNLITVVKPENDLWDNSDIKLNWKVSDRTLAEWRSHGIIGYVKVKGKIWYPKEAREEFISRNFINKKVVENE